MIIVEKPAKEAGRNAQRYVCSLATYMQTAKRRMLAEEYGLTLAHYMTAEKGAEKKPPAERVLATGALVGGRAVAWDTALREVNARLAKRSSRSKKPARHIIGSVHDDEHISPEACGELAVVLADELGSDAGIIMWALHGDTDNMHPHFLVLLLDEDGAATPFGRDGRSHEAMQRAIARLEHDRGFAREPGARYEVRDGEVQRTAPVPRPAKVRAPIRTEVLRSEAETGVESFTRFAQDVLAPHLDAAASWNEAQAALAPFGARVVKSGSGGEIRSGDDHHKVKLSNVDRALSWAKLNERWGEWSEPTIKPAQYEPRLLDTERASGWADRDQQAEALHNAVQMRIDRLKGERRAALCDIKRDYSKGRADVAGLVGEPGDLARVRQSHDATYRRRVDATKNEYRDRIAALRELRDEIDNTEVLDGIALDDVAAFERSLSIDWACSPAQPQAPPGFVAEPVGQSIQYWHDIAGNRPAFVERGDRIWINDDTDTSVRAALLVAQARYGVVAAHGDAAFRAQVQRLGRELGIDVQDGAVTPLPSARGRSPRIQQRRDAVRKWEARHAPSGTERPGASSRPDITDSQRTDAAARPEQGSLDLAARARRAILQRVARVLAADDWDPRDYRRADTGQGLHDHEAQPNLPDRQRSRAASFHRQHTNENTR